MTQAELDALMAGGLDDSDEILAEEDKEIEIKDTKQEINDSFSNENYAKDYRVSANIAWPPPPPTDDHKMVHQLDDVTKDSEEKATQMLDKLDAINNFFMAAEGGCNTVKDGIKYNIEIFNKLHEKFPNIRAFQEAIDKNTELLNSIEDVIGNIQMGEDEVMMTMDMMQYQDIHRQKIERVINVMRALSKYMSSLFEGKIDDEKRVGSAVHIAGDTTTENLVSNDDIEALIESLGKK
ncbi:chemotaxis protein [Campylobacter sp. RM16192]|uniref:chemotaxis protein n=1 Tax=Campylobacter sp. RM16192 TaxID=1660080 RepID=UPI0014516B9B|nr:chemotaxis protein [Campylobacter sp. RM16192]QCD52235.1 hypothetical protein CDOMC_0609 [Campylobacter sp. RM16192]